MEWAGGDGTPCGEAWWVVVGRLCCQLHAGPGSGRQEVTYGTSGSSPLHIILSLLSSQMAEVTPLTRFSYGYFRDKRGRAHRRSVWGLVLKKKLAYYSVFSCIDYGPGCMGTTRIWPTSYPAFMLPILSYSSTWRAGGSYQLVPKVPQLQDISISLTTTFPITHVVIKWRMWSLVLSGLPSSPPGNAGLHVHTWWRCWAALQGDLLPLPLASGLSDCPPLLLSPVRASLLLVAYEMLVLLKVLPLAPLSFSCNPRSGQVQASSQCQWASASNSQPLSPSPGLQTSFLLNISTDLPHKYLK